VLGKKVALDLGSQSVRLLVKGEGSPATEPAVVTREPSVPGSSGLYGLAAQRAAAEDPAVQLGRPVRGGEIADHALLRTMINALVIRAVGRQRIFKPDLVIAVMSGLGGDDRRLVLDAAMRAGARTVYLIDAVIAGAIGVGVPVSSTAGHLVVDVGAGKTEVAVLAMESTIARRTLPGHGGERLARAVQQHVREVHGVTLDAATTEDLMASLLRVGVHEERRLTVPGARNGSTASLTVTSNELAPALDTYLRPMVAAVHDVVRETPDTLLDDINREGLILFGGGARLEGLDRHLSAATAIQARVDREPQLAVIRGAGHALDNLDVLKRNLMYIR
jgi:rod shape-determining protein MreB and related proteins